MPQRVLQRVEHLRQLEAEELLGVEERNPVAAIEPADFPQAEFPQAVHFDLRAVDVAGQPGERLADLGIGIDLEMVELFPDQPVEVLGFGRHPPRAELPGDLELGGGEGWVVHSSTFVCT